MPLSMQMMVRCCIQRVGGTAMLRYLHKLVVGVYSFLRTLQFGAADKPSAATPSPSLALYSRSPDMKTRPIVQPITAREVLATFFPEHAWHTVCAAQASHTGNARFNLTCDCGAILGVDTEDCHALGIEFEAVRQALRHTPASTLRD